jgi:hypothetical protein
MRFQGHNLLAVSVAGENRKIFKDFGRKYHCPVEPYRSRAVFLKTPPKTAKQASQNFLKNRLQRIGGLIVYPLRFTGK